ncbi:DUF4123 domain-containing protein [Paracoccus sp. ME4]|uniref:DUF4123 domain-containing protein n=1 Tax=Paracoccus sp. ME4 TaxID=3138066 RepID=UPI00398B6EE8
MTTPTRPDSSKPETGITDDIWLGRRGIADHDAPEAGLAVERIAVPAPLDGQFGVDPKLTVPPALAGVLFPEDQGPDAHLYAVLDAGKIAGLQDRLEQSGLPHLCLLKGRTAEEMGDVAPWIVRLDAESSLLRNLCTRGPAPWQLWDDAPGILLRSGNDIATMQAHLRHFTRMRDEDGQWFFFRFWEPAVAAIYFADMATRPDLARLWFHPRTGLPIDMMAVITPDPTLSQALILRPRGLDQVPRDPATARLSRRDIARFAEDRRRSDAATLARELRAAFPDDLTMSDDALRTATETAMERLTAFGFRQRDRLFVMLAWELLFGPGFETIDPEGDLARIMRGPGDEADRFDRLQRRMEALG